MTSSRLISLDIARGLAIFVMVFAEISEIVSMYSVVMIGDVHLLSLFLPGPMLLMVSGASLFYWFRHIEKSGNGTKRAWTRTLVLLAFQGMIGMTWWSLKEFLAWELIAALGLTTILLWYLRHVKVPYLFVAGLAIILLAPVIQILFDTPAYWREPYGFDGLPAHTGLAEDHPLLAVTALIATGYYPVFPHFGFSLIGYAFGWWIQSDSKITLRQVQIFCAAAFVSGAGLLSFNNLASLDIWWLGYRHFPMTLPASLLYLGSNLFIMSAVLKYFDRDKHNMGILSRSLYTMGQNALYIYLLALMVPALAVKLGGFFYLMPGFSLEYLATFPHYWSSLPLWGQFYGNLLPVPAALFVGLLFNIAMIKIFSKPRYKPNESLDAGKSRRLFGLIRL